MNSNNPVTYSIITPCYNESKIICETLKTINSVMVENFPGKSFEIIPVDDGSPDDSALVISKYAQTNSCVSPIFFDKNQGKGAAIKAGLEAAEGDFIAFIDGDMDIHPSHLVDFFKTLENSDHGAVIGSKAVAGGSCQTTLKRRVFSWGYQMLNFFLFMNLIKDTQVDIKAFRKEVAKDALSHMRVTGYGFDIGLLVRILRSGNTIKEHPVKINLDPTASKITKRAILKMLWETLLTYVYIFHGDMNTLVRKQKGRVRPHSIRHFIIYPICLTLLVGVGLLVFRSPKPIMTALARSLSKIT